MTICIITHSINFEDFLSVNKLLCKEKTSYVISLYFIASLNYKNEKGTIKQLSTDVQVK